MDKRYAVVTFAKDGTGGIPGDYFWAPIGAKNTRPAAQWAEDSLCPVTPGNLGLMDDFITGHPEVLDETVKNFRKHRVVNLCLKILKTTKAPLSNPETFYYTVKNLADSVGEFFMDMFSNGNVDLDYKNLEDRLPDYVLSILQNICPDIVFTEDSLLIASEHHQIIMNKFWMKQNKNNIG